jgi:hypothetical protein
MIRQYLCAEQRSPESKRHRQKERDCGAPQGACREQARQARITGWRSLCFRGRTVGLGQQTKYKEEQKVEEWDKKQGHQLGG